MKDLVSVIIPFKNEEKFIYDCIESISNQQLKGISIEVILIDDCSTDSSTTIVKEYCKNNDDFYYVLNPSEGVIEALKYGFSISKGDFITRMDADDLMPAGKIQSLYNILDLNPKVTVSTGKVEYFATGKDLSEGYIKYQNWLNLRAELNDYFQNIYKECPIASPNWMMRRFHFEACGGFDTNYPEDYDLVFSWYNLGFTVKASNEITHLWRDHQMRSSRTSVLYADNSFLKLKVSRFLENELNIESRDVGLTGSNFNIGLIGAGKKGKKIASLLKENNINFKWYTSNPRKVGVVIYDVLLKDEGELESDLLDKLIVGISGPEDLLELKGKLSEISFSADVFYFF